MNQKLERFKRMDHEQVKKLVLKALCQTDSKACSQHTLTTKICQIKEVRSLRGQPRRDFEEKVNKAVGALLRTKPQLVERPKPNSTWIRLTVVGKKGCR